MFQFFYFITGLCENAQKDINIFVYIFMNKIIYFSDIA